MDEQKNLRVIFTKEADYMFADILESNGFKESEEEFDKYIFEEKETRANIIRGIMIAIAKKITPDEELIENLQKHLEISKESAENLVKDIKSKLLPLLLIYPDEKFSDPIFREEISKKVFGDEKNESLSAPLVKKNPPTQTDKLPPFIKRVEIKNVEENAEFYQQDKKYTDEAKKSIEEGLKEEPVEKIKDHPINKPIEENKKIIIGEETQKNRHEKLINEKEREDVYREPIE